MLAAIDTSTHSMHIGMSKSNFGLGTHYIMRTRNCDRRSGNESGMRVRDVSELRCECKNVSGGSRQLNSFRLKMIIYCDFRHKTFLPLDKICMAKGVRVN